jgi:transcriptional regulator with XRE-family HTH domain
MTYTQTGAATLTSPDKRSEMLFGEALREARERAGMTQAALAERTGISIRTIQGWEQGQRSPVSPDFFRLVNALNVSADTFAVIVEGKEPPQAPPRRGKKGK